MSTPPGSRTAITLKVNGVERTMQVEGRWLLSDLLRRGLGLTGTHVGCEQGGCGCCTVLVDGERARSCLLLAVQADGAEVETVESLASEDGTLHPLQEGFRKHHGLQCGYCTPGILMNMAEFIEQHPNPTDEEIRHALIGNLCRCTGYVHIVDAVREASKRVAAT